MKTTNSSGGFSWIQLQLFYANKTFNNHRAQKVKPATFNRLKLAVKLQLAKLNPQLTYRLLTAATIGVDGQRFSTLG